MRTDNPPDRTIRIIADMIMGGRLLTCPASMFNTGRLNGAFHGIAITIMSSIDLRRRILCSSRIMKKINPCHAIQNGGGTIAPVVTSHYFKAGVRDFLFALAIPHCCLIIEYE